MAEIKMKAMKHFLFTIIGSRRILWFFLALVFYFFTGGDKPMEIAVWLTPIFILRFFRDTKKYWGILLLLPFITIVSLITQKGVIPLPANTLTKLTIFKSIILLSPYFIDRLLYGALPKYIRTLLFPSLCIVVEVFINSNFVGGTWGNPAYGISNLPFLQFASLTGIWGILFFIYWTASIINEAWEQKSNLAKIRKLCWVYAGITVLIFGYGSARLTVGKPSNAMVKVAAITPPGPNYRGDLYKIAGQIFASKRTGILDVQGIRQTTDMNNQKLISETEKTAKLGVEIIAWPEGAAILFESEEQAFLKNIGQIVKINNIHLAMGLLVIKDNCQGLVKANKPFLFNKLLYLTPQKDIAFQYHKTNLAPGWEKLMTIPVENTMKVAATEFGDITGAICYDLDFPAHIRQAGTLRAGLLLAPSFDWPEIKNIHAKMARMRAIENGISILRPSSHGISIIADQFGNILSYVDDSKSNQAPLVAAIPVGSIRTLYPVMGDLTIWLSIGILLILVVVGIYIRLANRRKLE
jgi:apolipoprotein N-acyltransferase